MGPVDWIAPRTRQYPSECRIRRQPEPLRSRGVRVCLPGGKPRVPPLIFIPFRPSAGLWRCRPGRFHGHRAFRGGGVPRRGHTCHHLCFGYFGRRHSPGRRGRLAKARRSASHPLATCPPTGRRGGRLDEVLLARWRASGVTRRPVLGFGGRAGVLSPTRKLSLGRAVEWRNVVKGRPRGHPAAHRPRSAARTQRAGACGKLPSSGRRRARIFDTTARLTCS